MGAVASGSILGRVTLQKKGELSLSRLAFAIEAKCNDWLASIQYNGLGGRVYLPSVCRFLSRLKTER